MRERDLDVLSRITRGRRTIVCAVTIGEIQAGIEVTRAENPTRAGELEAWAVQVADSCNVLAMDAACF